MKEFNDAYSEAAEGFGKAYSEASEEFNKAYSEASKEFSNAFSDSLSGFGALFGSEETNDTSSEQLEENIDETNDTDEIKSVLGSMSALYGDLIADDLGIPKTIHYGDYELFKKDIDAIEAFFQEYADFMKKCNSSDPSMMAEYMSMVSKGVEAERILDSLDESKMSEQEYDYYSKVQLRIAKINIDLLLELD